MNFIKWCERVQELLFQRFRATLADVEINSAKNAWDENKTPEDFVNGVRDRFDLA